MSVYQKGTDCHYRLHSFMMREEQCFVLLICIKFKFCFTFIVSVYQRYRSSVEGTNFMGIETARFAVENCTDSINIIEVNRCDD